MSGPAGEVTDTRASPTLTRNPPPIATAAASATSTVANRSHVVVHRGSRGHHGADVSCNAFDLASISEGGIAPTFNDSATRCKLCRRVLSG